MEGEGPGRVAHFAQQHQVHVRVERRQYKLGRLIWLGRPRTVVSMVDGQGNEGPPVVVQEGDHFVANIATQLSVPVHLLDQLVIDGVPGSEYMA